MSERFRERLKSLASDAGDTEPEIELIESRGRRRRAARRAGVVAAAAAISLAVALPISALSGLVRSDEHETVVPAGTPTDAATASPDATQASPADQVPDVLHVVCTGDGMQLASTEVAAQSDGVHVDIEDGSAEASQWRVMVFGKSDGRFGSFIAGGPGKVIFPIPPTVAYAKCGDTSPNDPSEPGVTPFRVIDPNHFWVSEALVCDDPVDARGFRAEAGALSDLEQTAEDAIRDHVRGVLPTDEVLAGGYGSGPDTAWMIVRRSGNVLAGFQVVRASDDRWGVHWGDTCPGSGIGEG